MNKLNTFFLILLLTSCASTSGPNEATKIKTYSNSSNKAFLDEGVRVLNYAFPIEMNGIRMEKVSIVNKWEGMLFPMVFLEDIPEFQNEFFKEIMSKMTEGMAKEACNDSSMKELFDRDLYILYNIKDADGSFNLELRIDNAFCIKK